MANEITVENALTGESTASLYEMPNAYNGDADHLGFSDKTSYNAGDTATFYVDNSACDTIRVYRVGHYAGDNFCLKETLTNTGVNQTANATITSSNGATEMSGWTSTASWSIPSTAVSGLYVAVVERASDNTVQFRIPFVVRDDSRQADIVVGIPTSTWAGAYNMYGTPSAPGGGAGFYGTAASGYNLSTRTYAVSYDRPIISRGNVANHWDLYDSAAIDFLEKNGFDVKYVTSEDLHYRASSWNDAKAFISVGHDEYWSDTMKTNIEAFRDAGGHLFWWTANEVFWRIRYEDERTIWCYKDSVGGTSIDPVAPYFTGTWRDTRGLNPDEDPENLLTGTLFRMSTVNSDPSTAAHYLNATVDASVYGAEPYWRDTTVDDEVTDLTLTDAIGGEADDLSIPSDGRESVTFATSTVNPGASVIADTNGVSYSTGTVAWGVALHRRSPHEGFVFCAGSWAWCQMLSDFHEASAKKSTDVQQATVNLFYDLGIVPESLDTGGGLVTPTPVPMSDYGFTDYTVYGLSGQGYVPWKKAASTIEPTIETDYVAP